MLLRVKIWLWRAVYLSNLQLVLRYLLNFCLLLGTPIFFTKYCSGLLVLNCSDLFVLLGIIDLSYILLYSGYMNVWLKCSLSHYETQVQILPYLICWEADFLMLSAWAGNPSAWKPRHVLTHALWVKLWKKNS